MRSNERLEVSVLKGTSAADAGMSSVMQESHTDVE